MTALLDQPITAIAKAVKDGETTAVALAEAALARIEAVNPGLNAVVALNPELSLKNAAKADWNKQQWFKVFTNRQVQQ